MIELLIASICIIGVEVAEEMYVEPLTTFIEYLLVSLMIKIVLAVMSIYTILKLLEILYS